MRNQICRFFWTKLDDYAASAMHHYNWTIHKNYATIDIIPATFDDLFIDKHLYVTS